MFLIRVDTDLDDVQEELLCCLDLNTFCYFRRHFQRHNSFHNNTNRLHRLTPPPRCGSLVTRIRHVAREHITSTHRESRAKLAAKNMSENPFALVRTRRV